MPIKDLTIPIQNDMDVVAARQKGRTLAAELAFSNTELAFIATAISEVARNIIEYAKQGEVELILVNETAKRGIVIIARDAGPGIPSVERAMQGAYSKKGMGLGLKGACRLMDEFDVDSAPGKGTTVTMKKWAR